MAQKLSICEKPSLTHVKNGIMDQKLSFCGKPPSTSVKWRQNHQFARKSRQYCLSQQYPALITPVLSVLDINEPITLVLSVQELISANNGLTSDQRKNQRTKRIEQRVYFIANHANDACNELTRKTKRNG